MKLEKLETFKPQFIIDKACRDVHLSNNPMLQLYVEQAFIQGYNALVPVINTQLKHDDKSSILNLIIMVSIFVREYIESQINQQNQELN